VGAGRILKLRDDLGVDAAFAFLEAVAFAPGEGVDHPSRHAVEAGIQVLRPRIEAVERYGQLRSHHCYLSPLACGRCPSRTPFTRGSERDADSRHVLRMSKSTRVLLRTGQRGAAAAAHWCTWPDRQASSGRAAGGVRSRWAARRQSKDAERGARGSA